MLVIGQNTWSRDQPYSECRKAMIETWLHISDGREVIIGKTDYSSTGAWSCKPAPLAHNAVNSIGSRSKINYRCWTQSIVNNQWHVITKSETCYHSNNNCRTKRQTRNPQIRQAVEVSYWCTVNIKNKQISENLYRCRKAELLYRGTWQIEDKILF